MEVVVAISVMAWLVVEVAWKVSWCPCLCAPEVVEPKWLRTINKYDVDADDQAAPRIASPSKGRSHSGSRPYMSGATYSEHAKLCISDAVGS